MPVTVQWDDDDPIEGLDPAGSETKIYPTTGSGTVTVTDTETGESQTLNFVLPLTLTTVNVDPEEIDSAQAAPGDRTISVTGTGFPANASGQVSLNTGPGGTRGRSAAAMSATTSATGAFSAQLVVPLMQAEGGYHIVAQFGDIADLQAEITVVQDVPDQLATPENLTSPSATATTVDLEWDAVDDAEEYQVRYQPVIGIEWTELDPQPGTTQTVTGLSPDSDWEFQVRALADGFEPSEWSDSIIVSTGSEPQLDTPENLASTAQTTTSITMEWDAVTDAEEYTLEWREQGEEDWIDVAGLTVTEATVEDLEPGTTYEFRVRAEAADFLPSEWSAVVTQATEGLDQLDTPENFASDEVTATSVSLVWDAVTDADEYVVQWSLAGEDEWTSIDPVTDPEATVSDLSPDTEYDFRVRAEADGWAPSEWSDIVTETTDEAPQLDTPQNLAVDDQTNDSITLVWDAVDDAEEYVVEWSPTEEEDWTAIDPVTATTATVEDLLSSSEYDFRVMATAPGFANSEWSDIVTGETDPGDQLDTPEDLAAVDQTTTTVDLEWSAASDAQTYRVSYREVGETEWEETDPVAITEMTVEDLEPNQAYEFRVRAEAPGWEPSDWSPEIEHSTDSLGQLDAPENLAAGTATTDTIPISWDAVDDAELYRVQWWTGEPEDPEEDTTAATSFDIEDLDPETEYTIRVRAEAPGWEDSDWSDEIQEETEPELPQLDAPTGLASPEQGITSIDVQWNSVTDAEDYIVRWSITTEEDWEESDPVDDTAYVIEDLGEDTEYDIQVRAIADGFTDSDWSTPITIGTAVE